MNPDVKTYNDSQEGEWKKICELLAKEINNSFPEAENKIWHGAPVWFIEGNPIVGYDKLKDSVRLLFWSGQTFDEPNLKAEGSFKAAEIRYTKVAQINLEDLKRWLEKSKTIQWDYKNIVKKRGVLDRIS